MGFIVAASAAFGLGGALMTCSDGLHRLWPVAGIGVLFLVGALLLAMAVREEGLSVAYVVGLGCEAAIAVGLGRWVFDERLTPGQSVGLLLIAAGVASVRFG
jgi:multidrug transporter EmrE-like cation transporter